VNDPSAAAAPVSAVLPDRLLCRLVPALLYRDCSLVDAGLAPAAAIAAGTRNGGRLLGEPDAGTLRAGGPADFVLVHGDPLSEPAALWRVWRTSW
jgi:cytosine/adenosine deaminase-related metal-dependent hydrolase